MIVKEFKKQKKAKKTSSVRILQTFAIRGQIAAQIAQGVIVYKSGNQYIAIRKVTYRSKDN